MENKKSVSGSQNSGSSQKKAHLSPGKIPVKDTAKTQIGIASYGHPRVEK